MYVLIVGQPPAGPVPVPVLKSPKFESTDMNPYFETAKQTPTASMWDSVIPEGLTVLKAAWDSAVDLEFKTELTEVNQSDIYNETENYQNHMKKSLEMQREQAAAEWESSARLSRRCAIAGDYPIRASGRRATSRSIIRIRNSGPGRRLIAKYVLRAVFAYPIERWQEEAISIRAEVLERSWNAELGAFTATHDSADPDAAVLVMPVIGFLPPDDPRFESTTAALSSEGRSLSACIQVSGRGWHQRERGGLSSAFVLDRAEPCPGRQYTEGARNARSADALRKPDGVIRRRARRRDRRYSRELSAGLQSPRIFTGRSRN